MNWRFWQKKSNNNTFGPQSTPSFFPPTSKPVAEKSRFGGWWFRIIVAVLVLLILGGAWFALAQSRRLFGSISTDGSASWLDSVTNVLPGGSDHTLQGEAEGRVNILLLGMRGEGVVGGGLLADTIMVLSIVPPAEGKEMKASLLSIPRDLYVKVPNRQETRKINAVYALGEEREHGKGGMDDMRTIVSEVTGLAIPYAVTINFAGFTQLVDALGGVTINRETAFTEAVQFREPKVCDPYIYTTPTKPPQFELKYHTRKNGTRYVTKTYPLCYNKDLECGGVFELPAGDSTLNGSQALCYARARYQSSDFERAGRQQQVMEALFGKALGLGTLTDLSKSGELVSILGNNVRTNLTSNELQYLFGVALKYRDVKPKHFVLEDSADGLLYAPPVTKEAGYILLPRGDNYDAIRAKAQALLTQ